MEYSLNILYFSFSSLIYVKFPGFFPLFLLSLNSVFILTFYIDVLFNKVVWICN